MESEKILEFTRRVTMSNRSELVVIMYEILFTYLEEAMKAHKDNRKEDFKVGIRQADKVIVELQNSLNFSYSLADNLYPLYVFSREQLALSMMKYNLEGIEHTKGIMTKLYQAFKEVAKTDDSRPLMQNTQQIVAGMTYGKYQINEDINSTDNLRGFYV